jgi:ABC-2 type transport system ATP-binding protein
VLLLDEPTNGLDPQGMREVRVLLRRLADDGVTVFVSSHLLAEVEAMCDRVGVLARGRLIADGPPTTLRSPPERFVVDVDDTDRAEALLRDLRGVTVEGVRGTSVRVRLAQPATPAAANAALVSAGVGVSALVPVHDTLEDAFLALVQDAESGSEPDVLG